MSDFKYLPTTSVQQAQPTVRDGVYAPKQVDARSPASKVMTDFHHVPPVTIRSDISVERCHQAMIMAGVKSLIVVNGEHTIIGLVTAHDVMEKPMQIALQRKQRIQEINVGDVMTAAQDLPCISIRAVEQAVVGEIVATLEQQGVHYLLVTEQDQQTSLLRGLFSAAQIGRQLNTSLNIQSMARTFAQIGAAVAAA